ncbi:TPA: hypothetical protein ACNTF2_001639, partial [Escherichia coli]
TGVNERSRSTCNLKYGEYSFIKGGNGIPP